MSTQISERLHKNTIYKISSYSEITSVYTDFKRDGYIISSWNTKEDGTGTTYYPNDTVTILSDNVLYAQWVLEKYHVSFYMDDRTTLLKNETVEYGKSATPPTATKEYYDLSGWEGSYTNVSSDTSCYAIFTKRFLTNETTILDMSSHNMTGTSADIEHTCDEINPGVCCLVKGEYILLRNSQDYSLTYENNYVKWTGLHVGDISSQTAQVKVTGNGYYSGMVSTDFTISYERNGSGKFTVTFDPCGGDVPSEPQQIDYEYGDAYGLCSQFNVLDTTASRVGHDFLGWFKEGKTDKVLSTDVIEEENPFTLSAKWSPSTYTVTFEANGGTIEGWTTIE